MDGALTSIKLFFASQFRLGISRTVEWARWKSGRFGKASDFHEWYCYGLSCLCRRSVLRWRAANARMSLEAWTPHILILRVSLFKILSPLMRYGGANTPLAFIYYSQPSRNRLFTLHIQICACVFVSAAHSYPNIHIKCPVLCVFFGFSGEPSNVP